MRRAAALAITTLLAAAAAAGCSSSSSTSTAAADTYKSVTVTGTFGKAPTVTIPKVTGNGALLTKTLVQGSGAKLISGDAIFGNYVVYDWSGKTSKLLGSSYETGAPSLFYGQLLPGLETALTGAKLGSRVFAVIPPKDGFGTSGSSSEGIGAKDTLVFVIDLISQFPASLSGKQTSSGGGALPTVTAPAASSTAGPTIKIPAKVTPPKTLQVKDLIKGTGAVVKAGQEVAVQYTGVIWRTGKVFDSSWARETPFATPLVTSKIISGWVTGLVGQRVGSRVLLVIPPADAYKAAGESAAGIKGTDTLVFVVDILSAI